MLVAILTWLLCKAWATAPLDKRVQMDRCCFSRVYVSWSESVSGQKENSKCSHHLIELGELLYFYFCRTMWLCKIVPVSVNRVEAFFKNHSYILVFILYFKYLSHKKYQSKLVLSPVSMKMLQWTPAAPIYDRCCTTSANVLVRALLSNKYAWIIILIIIIIVAMISELLLWAIMRIAAVADMPGGFISKSFTHF